MKMKLKELAELVGGTIIGDEETEISSVSSIEDAKPGDITFIAHPKYIAMLEKVEASAIIISKNFNIQSSKKPLIIVENPYLAFALILSHFSKKTYESKGVDSKAWVSSSAQLGRDISIYPFAYIGDRCKIGDRVTIYPGVYVGEDSSIGDDSIIYSNVSIYPGTVIGKRVILHSGVVIGSDGFGYVKDGKRNVKIPQIGYVIIEDDVEIGANTTIDRATLGKTVIRRGVKIDNLVQVAHNVTIGEDSIIIAQVGIAGSTKIGSNVILAGQVGVSDHVEIGDNVKVAAKSGIPYDLKPNQEYSGAPAIPHREFLKASMIFTKLPEMRKTLMEIERRIKKIEEIISLKGKEN